jgi:choline dehydrogenase-like flavoprotein
MDTANRLGYHWETSPKLLDISKFKNGRCCGANTSLGCTCGAKWTARHSIHKAVEKGAILMTECECTDILTLNGQAVGIAVRTPVKTLRNIYAETVVLAAGGIPSPVLLQKSGIGEAGDGCFIDPTQLVYGISPYKGTHTDPLVSVVTWEYYDSHGIRLGTLIDPRLMACFNMIKAGPHHLRKAFQYNRMVGILVKVKDELDGWVDDRGRVSKALTSADLQKLDMGKDVASRILIEMGCRPDDLVTSPVRGAHPSGTCRIGHVVDVNLETPIKNLYVCDASVFPEALDRPTVITLVALAKRLSDHLTGHRRFKKPAVA